MTYIFMVSIVALLAYIFQGLNSPPSVNPPLDDANEAIKNGVVSKLIKEGGYSFTTGQIEAGFNCGKARTVTEKAICSSEATAAADRYLNENYAKAFKKLPPSLAEVLDKEQGDWLRRRDQHIEKNCISVAGEVKKTCIIDYYNHRSKALLQTGNVLSPNEFMSVLVLDPPSNVRDKPNGKVVCQIKTKKRISVYKKPEISSNGSNWYWTRVCGEWALIHASQFGS